MSREKYVVQLTDDARESLQKFVRGGTSSAREVARARILLKADDGWTVHRIAEALDVSPGTVCRIKRRFCEVGLQGAVVDRPRPGRPPKLDEKGEAHLIALACSSAPDGHDHWTLRLLSDKAVPEADTVRVVLDNLNTHRLGSLYVAFVPDEARRIARRLRFHYTPKHGSWLNMAEIELSVFSRGCLRRRVPDETVLRRRVHALQEERNTDRASIDWRFSIQDARTKLHRLYPSNN